MATIIRNQKLFCTKCGGEFDFGFPIGIPQLDIKIRAFSKLHEDCQQTWTEPTADQSESINERAIWWLQNGEIGNSSKVMFNCFMRNKNKSISHPYDPDDFSRCYKLLQAVPEWKKQLHRLKKLSPAWSNLVENWDKLTELYEDMQKNNKDNGMYNFMQTLIN